MTTNPNKPLGTSNTSPVNSFQPDEVVYPKTGTNTKIDCKIQKVSFTFRLHVKAATNNICIDNVSTVDHNSLAAKEVLVLTEVGGAK